VIAVRAGAARLRHARDPDRSLAALEAIEGLARQTAAEIDQIVGSLRRGSPADGMVEAPAGLASLDTLVARHRAAGLEITLETAGAPRPRWSSLVSVRLVDGAGGFSWSARCGRWGL